MTFKRRVLSALGKDQLLEIGRGLELEVTARMGVDDLREALAKSKRARLTAIIQESLPRDTLKDVCVAVGLDNTGKEKSALVQRILMAGGASADGESNVYKIDPATTKADHAADGATPFGALLPRLGSVAATKPAKAKSEGRRKRGPTERRRAGVSESEAVVSGSLKGALRQFALGAAGC